jgi:chromate transporter
MSHDPPAKNQRLIDLAKLFLKLGIPTFGGPAAHIAMMEDEVVVRRQWLPRQQFLDLLGAANFIPGPSSSEMAIYIGQSQAGWPGLLLGGACFILPAATLVGFIAWGYVRWGSLPQVAGILYGIKPVVIAVVLQALWRLGRLAIKGPFLAVLTIAAVAANLSGLSPVWVLAAVGYIPAAIRTLRERRFGAISIAGLPLRSAIAAAPLVGAAAAPASLGTLFWVFLKVGALVFGSGYVLLAFLRADLVQHLHWLSENQLLDAVAIGQVTPGPVFTTATFIGYLLAGPVGAVAATIAIFLPAFLLVSVSGPLIPRLRVSPVTGLFLDSVNAASLALMTVVTWQLGRAAIVDVPTSLRALASAALLLGFRVNSAWLVLGGAVVGIVVK